MSSELAEFNNKLITMILYEDLLMKLAFSVLSIMSFVVFFITIYNQKKRNWDGLYFRSLMLVIFIWSTCNLLLYYFKQPGLFDLLRAIRYSAIFLMPALLCLHVWRQVSYKEISVKAIVMLFALPLVLIFILIRQTLAGRMPDSANSYGTVYFIFFFYGIAVLIKAYLLCFNVFYQMPKHMRKSSYYILYGLSAVTLLLVSKFIWDIQLYHHLTDVELVTVLVPLISPVAVGVMVQLLLEAFYVAPASNVIATSREFVFENLSTLVLVLSNNKRILDWNKKEKDEIDPFPVPIYKEPFDTYLERIETSCNARLSDGVITLLQNGKETQRMITDYEIAYKKRKFGYLVEISEVTKVYSILRYLEEVALMDHLTGLYNRNAYIEMVERLVKEENMPLLIIVGDVNNLKQINDTQGHLCGDSLLKKIADIIKETKPNGSFAMRIGGDEFVLLMPMGDITIAKEFVLNVETICNRITDKDYGIPSISWGYSLMTSASQPYNDIFAQADAMMYHIKKIYFKFRSSGFVPSMEQILKETPQNYQEKTPKNDNE